ncbi:unnamed protein product [Schistosoma margrebowiei]|uniref:Uncharacterized protein n=1 Tax=Schistosoma margrebowiei TaxID=48269 RepID=A0A3P7XAK0_9TREM|nr:unnamed protein product [Schistosoma margrebowiei]
MVFHFVLAHHLKLVLLEELKIIVKVLVLIQCEPLKHHLKSVHYDILEYQGHLSSLY